MAKGQNRGNREVKKPKKTKQPPALEWPPEGDAALRRQSQEEAPATCSSFGWRMMEVMNLSFFAKENANSKLVV